MKVTILGNGPSLETVALPTSENHTVGVNLSYLKYWSPWVTSMDRRAMKTAIDEATPIKFVFAAGRILETIKTDKEIEFVARPPYIKYSGPFAYWYTLTHLTNYDEIYLLGFDLDSDPGHFHDKDVERISHYTLHRKSLKATWEDVGKEVDTKIWYIDKWIPIEERWDKEDLEDKPLKGRT